jgi:tryptophanyl-tRNA synthetase
LVAALEGFLEPIRERRSRYTLADVDDIIVAGSTKARAIAQETIEMVRTAMKMDYYIIDTPIRG